MSGYPGAAGGSTVACVLFALSNKSCTKSGCQAQASYVAGSPVPLPLPPGPPVRLDRTQAVPSVSYATLAKAQARFASCKDRYERYQANLRAVTRDLRAAALPVLTRAPRAGKQPAAGVPPYCNQHARRPLPRGAHAGATTAGPRHAHQPPRHHTTTKPVVYRIRSS